MADNFSLRPVVISRDSGVDGMRCLISSWRWFRVKALGKYPNPKIMFVSIHVSKAANILQKKCLRGKESTQ